ncbi:MAG: hypothetical protein KGO92_10035 [Bacteroidota bacterium]|nr:hypothetical protein [Bacteroidota bacterium]
MNALLTFFGRLHPLWVHLPIGFLLLAMGLLWLSRKPKYSGILPAVEISFLLGALSAVFACLSGWTLSSDGEYDLDTLQYHQWFGISVAILSLFLYGLIRIKKQRYLSNFSLLLFFGVLMTGHLGGTLTHGEGYLTKGIFSSSDSLKAKRKPIANVQEAVVFSDIIQPVLLDKCSGCHSAIKQKGGLRLDAMEWIVKGGKDGKVYIPGDAVHSDLYARVVMDPLEEKHMPPKGKTPLTEAETQLIYWWINSGAGFTKKVKEVAQPEKIHATLLALQSATIPMKKPDIPDGMVDPAAQSILDTLREQGIAVLPVAANSHFLSANFVSIPKPDNRTVALLSKIRAQLVWLKLGNAELSQASWKIIGECNNLTRLSIEHTNLSDSSIALLSGLNQLHYLNLVGTAISAKGLQKLQKLTALENLYLGGTAVSASELAGLQKIFPSARLDAGNYKVEDLPTDTQLLKAPVVKK